MTCRIDTPIEIDYYQHGGILPYVLATTPRCGVNAYSLTKCGCGAHFVAHRWRFSHRLLRTKMRSTVSLFSIFSVARNLRSIPSLRTERFHYGMKDMKTKVINWFQIPVLDINRATAFYKAVLNASFHEAEHMGEKHAFFAMDTLESLPPAENWLKLPQRPSA